MSEHEKRLAFLGITPQDRENLDVLRPLFQKHAQEFADRFYQHLLAHPDTAAFLNDKVKIERLKHLQVDYFARMLAGVFDEQYFASRLRVGQAHQRMDLAPVWYLGAFNQYVQLTFPDFVRELGGSLEKALPALLSAVKVIFLDISLALDSYFQKATEQLRDRNEELQRALGLYWQTQRREEQLRRLLSHEVRGGLAAVITTLEDLREQVQPALQRADLDQLDNVVRRCWSLTNLLQEMLRPGQSEGVRRVELRPLLDALAERFAVYACSRHIELVLPAETPKVWADPALLREALANLVNNAVRYLDKEPGRVEITCQGDGDFVIFCVSDNGPGFPDNVKANLFQPFVRGTGTPGQADGMGLGLCFVRNVIEQAGGRIWIESSPRVGSKVWFTVRR